MISRSTTVLALAGACVMAGATLTACAGAGGSASGDANTINVLMVNNPQMEDLQKLTADTFTKQTGITVHYTVLPENDLRNKASQEFSSQAGQYDVATLSNYEIPFYSKNGWLDSLDSYVAQDKAFDQADIIKPIAKSLTGPDGKLYGEPFYGESSFLMYRKDVFAAKHLTMPDHPTWQQIAQLAAEVDHAQPDMRGICLRGQTGWGEVLAPLTTVINTFGGTYWDKNWNAQVTSSATTQAVQFYVDLSRQHGEPGASQAGFTECLNDFQQSKTAMWYDSTAGAGPSEGSGSPIVGKIGYAPAPTVKTADSGWLYAWSWAIQKASTKADSAWKFISWASSKKYEDLVGAQLGWSKAPAGKRSSTYHNPQYLKIASAFAQPTLSAIQDAKPDYPGVAPRPAPGIQFVDIPEFTAFGDDFSRSVSSAIAGQTSVQAALQQGQSLAAPIGTKHAGK